MRHGQGWPWLLARVGIANAAMWLVLDQLHRPTAWWLEHGAWDRVGWLGVSIAAGAGVYFVVLFALGTRTRDFRLRQS